MQANMEAGLARLMRPPANSDITAGAWVREQYVDLAVFVSEATCSL